MTQLRAVSTSTEDYLEAILRLIGAKGAARVRDIAAALSLHKSTVSSALKGLSEKGLVEYSRYEITTLTELGKEIAQEVNRRHEVLRQFLTEILAIPGDVAEQNACRMEHVVDAEVLERLADLTHLLNPSVPPRAGWLERFHGECRQRNASVFEEGSANRSEDSWRSPASRSRTTCRGGSGIGSKEDRQP